MKQAIDVLCSTLIQPSESCRLKAYPDPGTGGAPWTIGWGHTGPEVKKGLVWTQKQADDQLHIDAMFALTEALRLSPSLLDESPEKQAAIADFIYNCGLGNYQTSTLKKVVDKDNYVGARAQIIKWTKAAGKVLKGLIIRRNKESELLK